MQSKPLVIQCRGAEFTLRRIDDGELHRLARTATQIEDDHGFWLQWDHRHRQPGALSLAEFFVGMTRAFGTTGLAFDDYKSSFCFPFQLTTEKASVRGDYLLLVEDWKGGVAAKLLRRCGRRTPQLGPIEPFVAAEFSRDDFRFVMNFLDGYLEGLQSVAHRTEPPVPDFVQCVDAAFLVYGYRDGAPFERCFDAEDEYREVLAGTSLDLLDAALDLAL